MNAPTRRQRQRRHSARAWIRAIVTVVIVTGIYFAVPLKPGDLGNGGHTAIRVSLLVVGLILLTAMVAGQARRALRPEKLLADQIAMLLTLITVVVTAFATVYYISANQFAGIHTRLDALYFSVVTLGTVGYGDITPVGQAARAIVTIQIVFDLIIVTSAITIIVSARRFDRAGK